MSFFRSRSLGWAASFAAVAGAEAADLPSEPTAPVAEFVKSCAIGGIAGFMPPGSDACMKIGGFAAGLIVARSLGDQFTLSQTTARGRPAVTEFESVPSRAQPSIGFSTLGEIDFDAVTNTAQGPLLAHLALLGASGEGFDPSANGVDVDNAYLTWAGLTAGRRGSFYDFFAGGPMRPDFPSIDELGAPTNLIAYTAAFDPGFGATLSLEQPTAIDQFAGQRQDGWRSPDIVAAVDVKRGWGKAHLAAVAHLNAVVTITPDRPSEYGKWGYGLIGGVMFDIPRAPGDDFGVQAAFSHAAVAYSGQMIPVWGEGDTGVNINDLGTQYALGDAYWTGSRWSTPDAWSVAAMGDFKIGANFTITPLASYGGVKYGGQTPLISNKASEFDGGAEVAWSPVHNLEFALEALYEVSHQSRPSAYVGAAFVARASGVDGRLRIGRSF